MLIVLGLNDPAEEMALATVIFLLDGKLVLLRPESRRESPLRGLKYDMKVLSDKIEWFTTYTDNNKQLVSSALMGSVWAWDGKILNVIAPLK
jgi:RAB6A-GEF complex partner protein 1